MQNEKDNSGNIPGATDLRMEGLAKAEDGTSPSGESDDDNDSDDGDGGNERARIDDPNAGDAKEGDEEGPEAETDSNPPSSSESESSDDESSDVNFEDKSRFWVRIVTTLSAFSCCNSGAPPVLFVCLQELRQKRWFLIARPHTFRLTACFPVSTHGWSFHHLVDARPPQHVQG